MNAEQATTNHVREFIIEIINTKKPETTTELVKLVQQKYPQTKKEMAAILLQLENENKIHFNTKLQPPTTIFREYLFSNKSIWYWLTIVTAIITTLSVFVLPENAYPLTFIRQIFGGIFVGFLPGYVFLKTLYPYKVPITTSSENLDIIERIAFSFGLSIALTAMAGLILNYTPFGIRLTPITLTLLIVTLGFATTAILREFQVKNYYLNQ